MCRKTKCRKSDGRVNRADKQASNSRGLTRRAGTGRAFLGGGLGVNVYLRVESFKLQRSRVTVLLKSEGDTMMIDVTYSH